MKLIDIKYPSCVGMHLQSANCDVCACEEQKSAQPLQQCSESKQTAEHHSNLHVDAVSILAIYGKRYVELHTEYVTVRVNNNGSY